MVAGEAGIGKSRLLAEFTRPVGRLGPGPAWPVRRPRRGRARPTRRSRTCCVSSSPRWAPTGCSRLPAGLGHDRRAAARAGRPRRGRGRREPPPRGGGDPARAVRPRAPRHPRHRGPALGRRGDPDGAALPAARRCVGADHDRPELSQRRRAPRPPAAGLPDRGRARPPGQAARAAPADPRPGAQAGAVDPRTYARLRPGRERLRAQRGRAVLRRGARGRARTRSCPRPSATSCSPATSGSTRRPNTSSGWSPQAASASSTSSSRRSSIGVPTSSTPRARAAVVANVLVVDDSAYTFRHALVREAVHGDLLPGERTRFHARYAEALASREKPGDITEIAYHWHAANNHAKAFPAKIAAMRSASQAYAYATAAQMGERALEIWDAIDDAEAVAGMPRSQADGQGRRLPPRGRRTRTRPGHDHPRDLARRCPGPRSRAPPDAQGAVPAQHRQAGRDPVAQGGPRAGAAGRRRDAEGDDPLPSRGALHDRGGTA